MLWLNLRDCQAPDAQSVVVVVVSPLIALVKDQVRGMRKRNITAVYTGEISDDATGRVSWEVSVCFYQS